MEGNVSASGKTRLPAVLSAGWPLLLVAIVGVAVAMYQLREDALAEARRNTANLARILAEQTARSVQAVDLALLDLQDAVAESRE